MTKNKNNLSTNYKLHLPWSSLVWAIPIGTKVSKGGELYKVISATRVPVPGKVPTLTLQKINKEENE